MLAIDLFSGIGGLSLAFKEVFPEGAVIKYVEKDIFRQEILRKRFNLQDYSIHGDIRTLRLPFTWDYRMGIIFGGFPCKGTSQAGKREGLSNQFSHLWWEQLRVIKEIKPKYVIIENPTGLLSNGIRDVLNGLRSAGYSFDLPHIISGAEVGAPHKRERVFIIAYSYSFQFHSRFHLSETRSRQIRENIAEVRRGWGRNFNSVSRVDDGVPEGLDGIIRDGWWVTNPPPHPFQPKGNHDRFKQIAAIGDSCIPQQAMPAFLRVKYLEQLEKFDEEEKITAGSCQVQTYQERKEDLQSREDLWTTLPRKQ